MNYQRDDKLLHTSSFSSPNIKLTEETRDRHDGMSYEQRLQSGTGCHLPQLPTYGVRDSFENALLQLNPQKNVPEYDTLAKKSLLMFTGKAQSQKRKIKMPGSAILRQDGY